MEKAKVILCFSLFRNLKQLHPFKFHRACLNQMAHEASRGQRNTKKKHNTALSDNQHVPMTIFGNTLLKTSYVGSDTQVMTKVFK